MLFDQLFKRTTSIPSEGLSKEFLLKESKSFCMLPWTSLQIRPDGKTYPCCLADDKGELGNAKSTSLKKIWNSKRMRHIRAKMLSNQPVSDCSYCYQLEKTTEGSFRKKFNHDFADHFDSLVPQTKSNGEVENMKLLYWDFRLSNFCNFKCRSCSHLSSSSWHEDTLKLYGSSALPQAVERVVDYRPQILDELLLHIDHVEEIYFAGGEPLLMEEHYKILDALIAAGRTDVKIWYNTNFSTLKWKNKDAVELWKQFPSVKVQASLDGSYKRGEYLRKGQKWDKTVANRKRLLNEVPHVKFEISATTSCYNVWHLPDFFREWRERGYLGHNDFYFNPLFGPNHMRVQLLPLKFREEAVRKYEDVCRDWVTTKPMKNRFENAIRWILEPEEEFLIKEFRKETFKMDQIRNENFAEVFPELQFLLGH